MNITYEREIEHCSPTTYVKLVTVKEVSPAENSDFLDKVTFEEVGWNAISQRGLHKVGEKVMFIPPESVLPFELSEKLGVTKYLSKGRVKVTKLRGNRSEGLIVDYDKVLPYLPYILQWEDLPSIVMRGDILPRSQVPPEFEMFYKIPNILNEPDTFYVGEEIALSEKVHGSNERLGLLKNPSTGEYNYYVGTHRTVLKEGDNVYWNVFRDKIGDRIPKDIVFFGEVFGRGIQHLHYDRKQPDILLFAAMQNHRYLNNEEFISICEEYNLPHIPFHITNFKSVEQIRELADEPSELTNSHFREGVVVVSLENPDRMAKCIGFKYLTSKSKSRTERH